MSNLIFHDYNDIAIPQRADGYISATKMCQAGGKRWNDFWRIKETQGYMQALESVAGIPATDLVITTQGGSPQLQGTWVHPRLASRLAQWISPEFAVIVDGWVIDIMTGNQSAQFNGLEKLRLEVELAKAQAEIAKADNLLLRSRTHAMVSDFVAQCITILPPEQRLSTPVDIEQAYTQYVKFCDHRGTLATTFDLFKGSLRWLLPQCYQPRRRFRADERKVYQARMKPASWVGFVVDFDLTGQN